VNLLLKECIVQNIYRECNKANKIRTNANAMHMKPSPTLNICHTIIIKLHLHTQPSPESHLQRHIGRNPPTLTLQNIPASLLCYRPLAILLVLRERCLPIEVLINHTRHTHLAMVPYSLRAEVPEWVLVLHLERKHVRCLAGLSSEVEAGEDAGAAGEWFAGLVEGGLHDGVILGEVVEFD
jgi:hypothetical protein